MISNFPALNGDTVTERHAAICRESGHATHTVDGVDSGICPRCGEVAPADAESASAPTYVTVVSAYGWGGGKTLSEARKAHAVHVGPVTGTERTLMFYGASDDAITVAAYAAMMEVRAEQGE